jgi:hypothetical protein
LPLPKIKRSFFKEKGMDHDKGVGSQLQAAGVSYTLLPYFSQLLHSVKYEQEKMV